MSFVFEFDDRARRELIAAATEAARGAYCPYSRFRVGAAVSAGGALFTGCNVENASYGLTICAERVAIATAVASGHRRLDALCVVCLDASSAAPLASRAPCGACRQVMQEFGLPELPVLLGDLHETTLGQLLPIAFTHRELTREDATR